MSKFCKMCGAGNPDSATNCMRCGKPLGGAASLSWSAPARSTPLPAQNGLKASGSALQRLKSIVTNPQNRSRFIAGVVVAVVVIVVLAMVLGRSTSLVGTWKTEEVLINGDWEWTETVTFNKDNTGVVTSNWTITGDSYSNSIRWIKASDNSYLVTVEDKKNFTVRIQGGKLIVQGGALTAEYGSDAVYLKH